jgi:hypothetical protein
MSRFGITGSGNSFSYGLPATQILPGSVTFDTAGTYSFTVPMFQTLVIQLYGAGGGGGGYCHSIGTYAGTGGDTEFYLGSSKLNRSAAFGGTGGQTAGDDRWGGLRQGVNGVGGFGINGDIILKGEDGVTGIDWGGGGGGASGAYPDYSGGAARPSVMRYNTGNELPGNFPGGGGEGFFYANWGKFPACSGGGGGGGYVQKTYQNQALNPFDVYTVVVGAGGDIDEYCYRASSGGHSTGYGAGGKVIITWS